MMNLLLHAYILNIHHKIDYLEILLNILNIPFQIASKYLLQKCELLDTYGW